MVQRSYIGLGGLGRGEEGGGGRREEEEGGRRDEGGGGGRGWEDYFLTWEEKFKFANLHW